MRLPGHNATSQARELYDLILPKLQNLNNPGAIEKFVQSRFEARMASHLKRAPWLGYAHTAIGVIAIGGAVATSTLAAGGHTDSTLILILGFLVAAATGLNQIFKFANRSAVRFRAGNELRREAWDYIFDRGDYEKQSPQEAFDSFYDKIWRIEAPVDASVELEPGQTGSTA